MGAWAPEFQSKMLSQLLLPDGFGQYHLEPLGEPSACLGTLHKWKYTMPLAIETLQDFLFSFLSVKAGEGFFHGYHIPRFLLASLFTKPMLKYVPYNLFQGCTAAASVSGAGREIPNNASTHHILKKFLPRLRGKKPFLLKSKIKMQICCSLVSIGIHNWISVERLFTFRAFVIWSVCGKHSPSCEEKILLLSSKVGAQWNCWSKRSDSRGEAVLARPWCPLQLPLDTAGNWSQYSVIWGKPHGVSMWNLNRRTYCAQAFSAADRFILNHLIMIPHKPFLIISHVPLTICL